MTDKLRDYFDEMVVYKDLKNNNFFSSLGLPAFLRDYLLGILMWMKYLHLLRSSYPKKRIG